MTKKKAKKFKRKKPKNTKEKSDVSLLPEDSNNSMSYRFGKAVKTLRLSRRLTQEQLAESIPDGLGVNQSYLSRLENGDLFPANARLSAICLALGVSVSEAWSLAESLDIPDSVTSTDDCNSDLLTCLSHEKLGLEFEDVSSVQEHVETMMQRLSTAIDRLHLGLITDGQIDRRDIETLKVAVKEIVLPAKAAQCIVDLLAELIDRSPQVAISPAETW